MTDAHVRPLRLEDSPAVLDAFLSSTDMARQGDVHDEQSATSYVNNLLSPHHRAWAIAGPDDRLVGLVVVTVDAANRNGWFWYWMHADARGLGWASRAAATVADWALKEGGLHRLELGHRANNLASGAVARAAGFVMEGLEREKFLVHGARIDVLTYGRLATDPVPDGPRLTMRQSADAPQACE